MHTARATFQHRILFIPELLHAGVVPLLPSGAHRGGHHKQHLGKGVAKWRYHGAALGPGVDNLGVDVVVKGAETKQVPAPDSVVAAVVCAWNEKQGNFPDRYVRCDPESHISKAVQEADVFKAYVFSHYLYQAAEPAAVHAHSPDTSASRR